MIDCDVATSADLAGLAIQGGNGGAGGSGGRAGWSGSVGGTGGPGGDGGLAGEAGRLIGMDAILEAKGLAAGMSVTLEQYPDCLSFRWFDGLAGDGGNGGDGGIAETGGNGGDGGCGTRGGKGGDGYSTGNGGNGGDACSAEGCSQTGLCLIDDGWPEWPFELYRWSARPGSGGEGGSGGSELPPGADGAEGSFCVCDVNEAAVLPKPSMPDGPVECFFASASKFSPARSFLIRSCASFSLFTRIWRACTSVCFFVSSTSFS